MKFIVRLETGALHGVWLAPWEGDPGRTCNVWNAKPFSSLDAANVAIAWARGYRPFPDATVERHRTDDDLLRWVVQHIGSSSPKRAPRWSHVANTFGLGSGYATMLCSRYGVDAEEEIGGCPYCLETEALVCSCNAHEF